MVLDNQFKKLISKWPRYVKTKSFLFFSGQLGLHPKSLELCLKHEDVENLGPAPNHSYPWVDSIEGPIASQSISAYESVSEILEKEGGDLTQLVRFHLYQRDKRFFPVFDSIRKFYEPNDPTPSTAVGMGHFDPNESVRFNIDGIAMNPEAEKSLGKRTALPGSIEHSSAAHFSHVVGAGPYLFVAGQIPTDTSKPGSPLINNYDDIPEEGHILKVGRSHEDSRNGPIAVQTWFTYDLIRKHLEGSGSSMEHILNLTVYLQDMRDFPTFHRIHETFFPSDPPALTVLQVAEVGHKGERIEIEPTAIAVDSNIRKEIIGEVTGFDRVEKSEACELVSSLTGDNSREVVSFGTEAGLFQEIGISTVVCGPGSIEQAHKVDEFIELSELKKCINFLNGIRSNSISN